MLKKSYSKESPEESKKAKWIPFIVAGDPSLDVSEKMVELLVEEGAELIELGVPFSDALADGPVIQAASERASQRVSIFQVLDLAEKISVKYPRLSIILFTYFNPILRIGIQNFAIRARKSGVAAALVVDLPPEEAGFYCDCMKAEGVKTIFLASPTTSSERMRLIDQASTGFIYYVSRTGVTGVQSQLSSSLETEIAQFRKLTEKPIAIGFGISTPEQAQRVAQLGDAVVVGSAFVQIISGSPDFASSEGKVRELARGISKAISEVKEN
jgi:tryptophan synthase alpha chain